jgi:hypothetical protein
MIPRIIHQIWIGNQALRPAAMMETWRHMHPEWEYRLWTEVELLELGLLCGAEVAAMREMCGKADVIRWELLARFGGVAIDADSVCLAPIDDLLTTSGPAFASYENEQMRPGLVATGTMGFEPGHPICVAACRWIRENHQALKQGRAWETTGPRLLTTLVQTYWRLITVLPSHLFLPVHYTGATYRGHGKVYAHQEWGSTRDAYKTLASSTTNRSTGLTAQTRADLGFEATVWVSILVSSWDTDLQYVRECLDSIREQQGADIGLELVWVNDGSTAERSAGLSAALRQFECNTRNTRVIYLDRPHEGIAAALNAGLAACTCELVFKMDADDIMVPDRIKNQLEFMTRRPDCVVCGGDIAYTTAQGKEPIRHPRIITWPEFCGGKAMSHWIMNHPTLCYRREAVLAVGGYDPAWTVGEDFHLEVRLLKTYGVVYNLPIVLVKYRIHDGQITRNHDAQELWERQTEWLKAMTTPA